VGPAARECCDLFNLSSFPAYGVFIAWLLGVGAGIFCGGLGMTSVEITLCGAGYPIC